MAREMAEQPRVLAAILGSSGPEVDRVVAQLRSAGPRQVVLAARGTSDHAAVYGRYLVETMLRLPTGPASISVHTVYRTPLRLDGVLWVAVSQSGGSPDLVESTRAAAAAGATTLALTNDAGSELAATAGLHLDIGAGPERAVAATKTYTASLLTLWLLVSTWAGSDVTAAAALPDLADETLAALDVVELAGRYRFAQRLVTTSRGYSYATALETALKLMETCYVSAQGFSAADLMHGPVAMVDSSQPVVAVLPDGPAGTSMLPTLDRLTERGADLCVVGTAPYGDGPFVPVPAGVPDSLSPLLEILPLQLLALEMAVARGLDPDAPRGLAKETHTR